MGLTTMLLLNDHHNNGYVLKMDVEGAEWEVFCNAGEEIKKFDQIVVEMHNLLGYANRDMIISALTNLSKTHSVVHIHPNNFDVVQYCGEYVTPNTIEVTLLNKSVYRMKKADVVLPRGIDEPSNPEQAEIWLGRW